MQSPFSARDETEKKMRRITAIKRQQHEETQRERRGAFLGYGCDL